MVGAAAGGLYLMLNQVTSYTMGGLGIFGILNFINGEDASGVVNGAIGIVIAVVIAFILTFFFWKDDVVEEEIEIEIPKVMNKDIITSPVKGTVASLSTSKDDAFSSGALGKGVVISPENGKVVAPFDGTVMTVFPTKHAIGLISDNGMELLIHIGLDTVQLEGKYFETFVKQGDKVTRGQTLVTFDKEAIEAAGFSTEIPVIITNSDDYLDILEPQQKEINLNDDLITALI